MATKKKASKSKTKGGKKKVAMKRVKKTGAAKKNGSAWKSSKSRGF